MNNSQRRFLTFALGLVVAAESALLVAHGLGHFSDAELATALIAGWAYVGGGLVVRNRRPENKTGALMILVGISFLAGMLGNTAHPQLQALGSWVWPIYLAVFLHLLLAFPNGTLGSPLARTIAITAYLDLGLLDQSRVVLGIDGLGGALYGLSFGVGAMLFFLASGMLVQRWRTSSRAWQRAVAPVLWPGAFTLGTMGVFYLNAFLAPILGLAEVGPIPRWIFYLAFTVLPFAFLAVLVRSRLARGSVAELVIELDESGVTESLRDAIARALGDPSLRIAYWLPTEERYVDVAGRPTDIEEGNGKVATIVEREGRRVAVLTHDEALNDEPGLVRAVSAAAALALENERLQAELRAHVEELRESRARVVKAADLERERIERNLHDGTQQRLTSVAMALGLAESRLRSEPEAAANTLRQTKEALASILADLRDLSQGIHPRTLTERGLGAALEDLAYTAPLPIDVRAELNGRLPPEVEAGAYYVVAEALANVAKHAGASSARVVLTMKECRLQVDVADDGVGGADLNGGTGLRGLKDRVAALGGSLQIDSPHRVGTRIRATIPCA